MKKILIDEKDLNIINNAALQELTASHMYRNLSAQCKSLGYFGAAKFFDKESQSEIEHYKIHEEFANDRGVCIESPEIKAQTLTVSSLKRALLIAYNAEYSLGELYNKWYGQVSVPTQIYLMQFIEKQTKSIGEYGDLLARIELIDNDTCGLIILDQELGNM